MNKPTENLPATPETGGEQDAGRRLTAERLADFRRRTAGRGSPSVAELLQETRAARMRRLTGSDDGI